MRTVIQFGPQHPVWIEPLRLKLSLDGEKVRDAELEAGYVRAYDCTDLNVHVPEKRAGCHNVRVFNTDMGWGKKIREPSAMANGKYLKVEGCETAGSGACGMRQCWGGQDNERSNQDETP